MTNQNVVVLAGRFILKDFIWDIFYWPIWWYSLGLLRFAKARARGLISFEESIGLTVWIVNWTKPMYGQYDFVSRLISLLVRTLVIFVKLLMVAVHLLFSLVAVGLWLIIMPLTVYGLWLYLAY